MKNFLFFISFLCALILQAKENRWTVNGPHSVQWETSKGELPYTDHIEMSGLRASVVYYWGVNEKKQFQMGWTAIWCSLCSEPFPIIRTPVGCLAAMWIS